MHNGAGRKRSPCTARAPPTCAMPPTPFIAHTPQHTQVLLILSEVGKERWAEAMCAAEAAAEAAAAAVPPAAAGAAGAQQRGAAGAPAGTPAAPPGAPSAPATPAAAASTSAAAAPSAPTAPAPAPAAPAAAASAHAANPGLAPPPAASQPTHPPPRPQSVMGPQSVVGPARSAAVEAAAAAAAAVLQPAAAELLALHLLCCQVRGPEGDEVTPTVCGPGTHVQACTHARAHVPSLCWNIAHARHPPYTRTWRAHPCMHARKHAHPHAPRVTYAPQVVEEALGAQAHAREPRHALPARDAVLLASHARWGAARGIISCVIGV